MADGSCAARHDACRDCCADRCHVALGRSARSLSLFRQEGRQALDRRRGRQDLACAGAACRGRGRGCSHDQRPRLGTHRRHAGQARSHPRLQRESSRRTISPRARNLWLRHDWPDRRDRSRRSQALRAARCDRHRRKSVSDLRLHHEQETRRRHRRARARCKDRLWRIHEN